MSLENLPVSSFIDCDNSTLVCLRTLLEPLNQLLPKWKISDSDISIISKICYKFRNQHKHFIYFRKLLQIDRHLRKMTTSKAYFALNHFNQTICKIVAPDICLSKNCIDYNLLALFTWQKELELIKQLAIACWKLCERQMLTGHFVKLMVFTMTTVARLLILSEVSLNTISSFYNSLFVLRDRIPNAGVFVNYTANLPLRLAVTPSIPINDRSTKLLNFGETENIFATPILKSGAFSQNSTTQSISSLEVFNKKVQARMLNASKNHVFGQNVKKFQSNTVNANKKENEKKDLIEILRRAKNQKSNNSNFLDMLLK